MCDSMVALGMALDGGKDSLSMAAKVNGTPVKAPGELVMTFYAPCTGKLGVQMQLAFPLLARYGRVDADTMCLRHHQGGDA